MRFIFFDPAPRIAGVGVLTPAGSGAQALIVARESGGRPFGEIIPDLGASSRDSSPSYRRADHYGMLGVAAARDALANAGVEPPSTVDASWGAMIGSGLGCWASIARFYEDLQNRPVQDLSPSLFARTASSAVTRDISLAFHLGGPSETFVSGWTAGADALVTAGASLVDGGASWMLAGGIEAPQGVFKRMLATARRQGGFEWLPECLVEGAACALLGQEGARGALRLRSYWRGRDPAARWSLGDALAALDPIVVRSVIVANSTPPDLLSRWRAEAAGRSLVDLSGRIGELGAAGSIVATAMACALDSDGVLVISRGIEGNTAALALTP